MKAIVSIKNESTHTVWGIVITGPAGFEEGWFMAYASTREEIENSIHTKYPGIPIWYYTPDLARVRHYPVSE